MYRKKGKEIEMCIVVSACVQGSTVPAHRTHVVYKAQCEGMAVLDKRFVVVVVISRKQRRRSMLLARFAAVSAVVVGCWFVKLSQSGSGVGSEDDMTKAGHRRRLALV